jgi:DNA-binding MarR family transcriptional regulator
VTLVEFLAPLKSSSNRNQVLAVLYYQQRYGGSTAMTVETIRAALGRARVPKAKTMNVADVLAKSGEYVDSPSSDGSRRLWQLTPTGEKYVRELLDLPAAEPEIEHDVGALTALAGRVQDDTVRGYVEEAIKCLQVGALRAAVVFLWSGAIHTLHVEALNGSHHALNAALQKHYPKAKTVSKVDDFAYINDRTFLEATVDVGLLDKGERDTLIEGLNLRNRCGHPTKAVPGVKKASSFIEDVLTIVFA